MLRRISFLRFVPTAGALRRRRNGVAVLALAAFVLAQLWPVPARLETDDPVRRIAGPVLADVVEVRDGDTVEVEAYIWPNHTVRVAVRLRGIDAPEERGKCEAEKRAAARAGERLKAMIGGDRVELRDIEGDKYYGRVVADLGTEREPDLARALLRENLVRPYDGGRRKGWCAGVS